ncbi:MULTISPECIES: hypothetical protein [unclassified Streptomyces]|uniref:hypothetical protein n=1 Tax=unclassified Streptomyces TaxID=2593676 RepID=UPI00382EB891
MWRLLRKIRDLTQLRSALTQERTRHKHRVEKVLEDAQIKLSSVLTNIFGLSGRMMLDALVAGVRDPRQLAELAQGKAKAKREALAAALTGQFDEHHAYLLSTLLEAIDRTQAQLDDLTGRIEAALTDLADASEAEPRRAGGLTPQERLDAIPGIGPTTAQVILAGSDSTWPSSPPRAIWSRGPSSPHEPSSPPEGIFPAASGRATPG